MTDRIPTRCDVLVIGGGPAGATAAAFLARAGLDVACVERERFPRFHVGESLLPANIPLFERLGVLSRLEASGFIRKHGAAFIDEVEGREVSIDFRRGPTWADHAYNVSRADFDCLLLEHARKEGAAVCEGARVDAVDVRGDGVRIGIERSDGARGTVQAAFLIDASGRDAVLATRLGRREPMPDLGKVALFAHYRGARRWPGRREGFIRIHLFRHGWFWWIPLAGDLTSVGCVLHRRVARAGPSLPGSLFEEMLIACPRVAAGLAGARRATDVWSAANFSYRTRPAVGDRFIAIGDAVTFVDPIFSSGVYIAMQSAELAAGTVADGFQRGDFRVGRFDRCRRVIEGGSGLFFRLIEQFYDPAFLDVFFLPRPPTIFKEALTTAMVGGAFLQRPPWLRLRLAVLRLLAHNMRSRRRRQGRPVDSRLPW